MPSFSKAVLWAALAVLLCSCGLLTPQEQSNALAVIEQMRANNVITLEQFEALRQAILSGGTAVWWQSLVEVAAAAGLAYVGVSLRRGPPTQKGGLPQSKVHP